MVKKPPSNVSSTPRAWQRMLSGRRLDLLDPSPVDVEIEDIAHGLARVARWNGQTIGAYAFSVAQHSVMVEALCVLAAPNMSPRDRLMALLHDASEYVVGDMISPVKNAIGVDYRGVEDRLQEAIHLRFGLPAKTPVRLKAQIKKADLKAARIEATGIAGFTELEAKKLWGAAPKVPAEGIFDPTPWSPELAKERMIQRCQALSDALSR